MTGETSSTNGTPHDDELPPVEPPSPRFILQLFLVPLILVAVFGSVVYFLFGWLGVGTTSPDRLLDDLENNRNQDVRWMAAQDLAQILPRDESLRRDVGAALRVAAILKREMENPPPSGEQQDQMDFLKFLPAAVANFQAPVGLPLLIEIVGSNVDKIDDEGHRLRLYNALVALAIMGSRLKEFDQLPQADREQLLGELQEATMNESAAPGKGLAHSARAYLLDRKQGSQGLMPALQRAARSSDELARKYTIIALANWREEGTEQLLRELSGPNDDLTRFENEDHERGARREIRQNAALALARRGSPLTPWHIVLETLDEETLRKQTYLKNSEMATATLLKALTDLRALKAEKPAVFAEQQETREAVEKLASSPTAVVEVEARKVLGGAPEVDGKRPIISRELLLVGTFGAAVVFLLGLAVFARWKRKPATVA